MSIQLIPNEVVKATGGRYVCGIGMIMMTSVCTDSRKAVPGCLFVPLKGRRHDGHRFVEEAFRKGATGALIQRSSGALSRVRKKHDKKLLIEVDDTLEALAGMATYWRLRMGPRVVAITGSRGDDDTFRMALHIARRCLGAPDSPERIDSPFVLSNLMMGLNANHRAVVVALDAAGDAGLYRLMRICEPSALVLTDSRSEDSGRHCGALKCLENEVTAVANAGDPGASAAAIESGARRITYGDEKADIRAGGIRTEGKGRISFDLHVLEEKARLSVRLPGADAVTSALGAAAAAHAMGLGIGEIKEGLEDFPG